MIYIFSALPAAIILVGILLSGKFRQPTRFILLSFLLGLCAVFPAGVFGGLALLFSADLEEYGFLAAIIEEPLKFLALYFVLLKQRCFSEHQDALVFGASVALGFATIENLGYILFYGVEGVSQTQVAWWRALSAVPMHASCGVVMGYFFGRYLLFKERRFLALALVNPILLHGVYNFFAFNSFGAVLVIIVLAILYCDFLLGRASAEKPK